MNDTTTQTAPATDSTADATTTAPAADAPKQTVDLVKERRVFATLALAGTALGAIAAAASDFDSVTIVAPGAHFDKETSDFIPEAPEWTADSHEIMLAPLATKAVKAKADGPGNVKAGDIIKPAKLIALVFTPIPTVDAASADTKGLATLIEVWQKEMNHRAVRKLRNAENVLAAASEMPLSLESYVEAQESAATGLAAFDDHWLTYSQALAKIAATGWGARFPAGRGKAAIRGAIENKAKALALFPELEAFGPSGDSLFVRLLQGVINAATKAGQDTTLLTAWLETRDEQTYDPTADTTGDLDLDSLFADMATDDETGDGEADDATDTDDGEGDPPTVSDETAEAAATE